MSDHENRQRVGIMGGTFDPIHVGHLLIAEHARDQLNLDQVRFIPAALSPLKEPGQSAAGKHRLEMLQLAIGGNPHFTVDDRELQRGGKSFTVETLNSLATELPKAELVFLMGADSLLDFARWREPHEICKLAFVVVLGRGGYAQPDLQLLEPFLPADDPWDLTEHQLHLPVIEISSTDIRQRIATNRSIRYQLPSAVEAYIAANNLYQVQ